MILSALLLEKGYTVHGLREYSAIPDDDRTGALDGVTLHYGDMADGGNLTRLIDKIRPDEIYNLAAMSHVHVSFAIPEHTANVNALGPLRLLESIRALNAEKDIRFYQASSSEMFGRSPPPQDETTPFAPCSPYGAAKLFAYWSVRNYREGYGLHASNGILFNHESALRGMHFVTRKITKGVGEIAAGVSDCLYLGNLDAARDWGHAKDYMAGAWHMLQQDSPGDYVLATGIARTVRDFASAAFACAGMTLVWTGEGMEEKGIDRRTGQVCVKVDPALFRPQDIPSLIGDAAKARDVLGWTPQTSFEDMVAEMVDADRMGPVLEKAKARTAF